jgi:argininosuccinate lyase
MKGLPLAYNRDLQEDKVPLFDTVDTVKACVAMVRELMGGLKVKKDKMLTAAQDGFMNATDLADYLVRHGVPFRTAHAIAGKIVQHCIAQDCRIEELPLTELKRFSARIDRDVYNYLSAEAIVARRRSLGGTAQSNVRRRLKELRV